MCMHIYIYIYIYIFGTQAHASSCRCDRCRPIHEPENLDFRGFDSSRFFFARGGFPLNEPDSNKSRLWILRPVDSYIYIYTYRYIYQYIIV